MATENDLTPEQIQFTNAFNEQRTLLAGFAKCANHDELSIVRDGFYLGLASSLCPIEADPVKRDIVMSLRVAESTRTTDGFTNTIIAARASTGWEAMITALFQKAEVCDSDLEGIWSTLEDGRMEWLTAVSQAHSIKMLLRDGLRKDGALDSAGDVSDAKMIWMYALCLNIPSCKESALQWSRVVQLSDPEKPLVGYQQTLWDARKEEWRPIDLGAQAAAERGGSTIDEAWKAE